MAFPNQTIYNAGQAGQGTAPATVDFVALSPNEYNVTEAQGTATFPISGISKVRNNDGGTTFNGEVRAVTDGSFCFQGADCSTFIYFIILFLIVQFATAIW